MMPDPVVLFATVILIVPMAYFLLAAPAFLLVKLDIPPVTQLMRGMFSSYFLILAIAGVIATLAIALIAAFAVSARRWFLERMDAELTARDAGDANAVRKLRRLHWGGMLCNAVQLVAIVAAIPYISVTPA
jgi:hypothetical protein